jgi:hypothetical protein
MKTNQNDADKDFLLPSGYDESMIDNKYWYETIRMDWYRSTGVRYKYLITSTPVHSYSTTKEAGGTVVLPGTQSTRICQEHPRNDH